MVFSSHIFIFYFLPLTLLFYYSVPRRFQHLLLIVVSYIFYGWANPLFVVLMMVSTFADFVSGLVISGQTPASRREPSVALSRRGRRSSLQKTALLLTICLNLALLGFFKYFHFGVDSYNSLVMFLGWDAAQWRPFFRVALPLGISFYTFHAISYVVDVYRGDARALRNYIDYACYVAMFPQLVAGPIVRFQDLADQMSEHQTTAEKNARGIAFFCFGLAKKVLLANPCGKVADIVFGADTLMTLDAWLGIFAYAFQIYFDFSGYSDMAIGLGLMLGFVYPKNFDSPYRAQSLTEFWIRWHISLSTWLRDYLYVPLGGNRGGTLRTCVNLMIVMVLGGLWHGASWTYVVWGGLHGLILILERFLGKKPIHNRLPGPIKTAVTFIIICFTWVFFRAETLPQAIEFCRSLIGLSRNVSSANLISGMIVHPYYVTALIVAGLVTWGCPQTGDFTHQITWRRASLAIGLLWFSVMILTTQSYNPFIYFMF